jgi:hypothetical protein
VRPWRLLHGALHPAWYHLLWQAVPHVRDGVLHAHLLEDFQPSQAGVSRSVYVLMFFSTIDFIQNRNISNIRLLS